MIYSINNKNMLIGPLLLLIATTTPSSSAFLCAPLVGSGFSKHAPQKRARPVPSFSTSPAPTNANALSRLWVVADAEQEEKQQRRNRDNSDDDSDDADDNEKDWIRTATGGFIPNLTRRFRNEAPAPSKQRVMTEVTTLQDYKDQVVDEQDAIVCVRFYAPWCRACKAVQSQYRQLATVHPTVKFVQVPLTKDNAFLHTGLGIPSLPFAHIYHPVAGLVEERSINKKIFGEFKEVLQTYVNGECPVDWDNDGRKSAAGAVNQIEEEEPLQ
jgi:thiol-disulfide isomerase/thioredoxin